MLFVGHAEAISRYESTSMSCRSAQEAVAREGAVILRYPGTTDPSLTRYDRYVAHGGYCTHGEYAETAFVPTQDRESCPVRRCATPNFDDRGGVRTAP